MNKKDVKRAITEALEDVYHCERAQGCLSDMQKQFIELAVKKIFGEDVPKVPEPPPAEKPEEGGVFFHCDVCGKKCSSSSGLTLHKKSHA